MIKATSFLIFSCICFTLGQDPMYCESPYKEICEDSGAEHIACLEFWETQGVTYDDMRVADIDEYKNTIIAKHNELRDKIAAGGLEDFPKASNLSVVTWDDDLAYGAQALAKTCVFEHDECHGTPEFPQAGQNIAEARGVGDAGQKGCDWIPTFIDDWFGEYKDASSDDIESLAPGRYKTIGHFTVMVHENTIKIGCACTTFNEDQVLFVCNYSGNNDRDEKIYAQGASASQCKKGKNANYSHLCN